ncbi:methyltransferase [Candidatus Woesearchaeota archaeon]|nr:methyltransferase [Candidatus Woesearchaeota archaeon]
MEALVLCHKGIEDIVCQDVKELLGKKAVSGEGRVTFSVDSKEELCTLCYLCQSIQKVILIDDLKRWMKGSFKVGAGHEIGKEIGAELVENYKAKVDLENPDVIVYVFDSKRGIDFSGKDLSKRNFRIFPSPRNLKAPLAYAMVRLSEFKDGETLVDPFCGAGSIILEATHFSKKRSVHFFEKDDFAFLKFISYKFEDKEEKIASKIYAFDSQFKHVDSAKKNAKIAGVHKEINFSRLNIEWLDTKFGKESVDRIVSYIPDMSKHSLPKVMQKIYKEFFHQAAFVLKKKGKMVLCTRNPKEIKGAAKEFGFSLEQREVWQGKEKLSFLTTV